MTDKNQGSNSEPIKGLKPKLREATLLEVAKNLKLFEEMPRPITRKGTFFVQLEQLEGAVAAACIDVIRQTTDRCNTNGKDYFSCIAEYFLPGANLLIAQMKIVALQHFGRSTLVEKWGILHPTIVHDASEEVRKRLEILQKIADGEHTQIAGKSVTSLTSLTMEQKEIVRGIENLALSSPAILETIARSQTDFFSMLKESFRVLIEAGKRLSEMKAKNQDVQEIINQGLAQVAELHNDLALVDTEMESKEEDIEAKYNAEEAELEAAHRAEEDKMRARHRAAKDELRARRECEIKEVRSASAQERAQKMALVEKIGHIHSGLVSASSDYIKELGSKDLPALEADMAVMRSHTSNMGSGVERTISDTENYILDFYSCNAKYYGVLDA